MNEIERAARRTEESEIEAISSQLGAAYRRMLNFYRKDFNLEPIEADQRARGLDGDDFDQDRDRIASEPASRVSWWDLTRLTERDPALAVAQWERVKRESQNELVSGHRTAAALEWHGTPWERARFLALRNAFAESWQPRGRIEAALIDMLATEFSQYLKWTEQATMYSDVEMNGEKSQAEKDGYWVPPRVGMAEAIEWPSSQAERAHRRFLVTLKALQEMRRLPAVYVNAAERVTVGGQHVHVSETKSDNNPIAE